jgi:hypothetical protein
MNMDHKMLVAIAGIALAIAGFAGVILMEMARTIWSLRRALNNEERNRRNIIDNIKQALRITFAYDASLIIRKFIEQEQEKLPALYIKTDDPDEAYVPYHLNLTRRWMKPIRDMLERELTGDERTLDGSHNGETSTENANAARHQGSG